MNDTRNLDPLSDSNTVKSLHLTTLNVTTQCPLSASLTDHYGQCIDSRFARSSRISLGGPLTTTTASRIDPNNGER